MEKPPSAQSKPPRNPDRAARLRDLIERTLKVEIPTKKPDTNKAKGKDGAD